MTACALVELLQVFDSAGIQIWLDGGWGVDALLQEQTRPRKDVDIVVRVADTTRLQEMLEREGFTLKEGTPPNSFVLADGAGYEVDVHTVEFDEHGNGIYRMQNGEDWTYPSEGFVGVGIVGGRAVRCLSPEVQVLCHAHGYAPVEKDLLDMERLAEHFGVELPQRLRRAPK